MPSTAITLIAAASRASAARVAALDREESALAAFSIAETEGDDRSDAYRAFASERTRESGAWQQAAEFEATAPARVAELADAQAAADWVAHRIKTLVGISTRVEVLPSDSLERTLVGKARRVFDRRAR